MSYFDLNELVLHQVKAVDIEKFPNVSEKILFAQP